MIDPQYLANMFMHHPPNSQEQISRYQLIRERGHYFAMFINENLPDCPEKRIAIDQIRDAVMWANAGIACNEPKPVYPDTPYPEPDPMVVVIPPPIGMER